MRSAVLTLAVMLAATTAAAQQVYEVGNGVTAPIVVKEVRPVYTPGALKARIEGTVSLEGVVREDGTIADLKVVKPLDAELDQQAIKALAQWQFKPGMRNGKPVPVRITCELRFTLK